jgi:hypothetical protein
MTAAHPAASTGGASCDDEVAGVALAVVDWLRLAAAPTFAIMALVTGILGSGQPDMLCSAGGHASALTGMTAMYGLMCAFHLPPWLKLVSGPGRANDTGRA